MADEALVTQEAAVVVQSNVGNALVTQVGWVILRRRNKIKNYGYIID